METKITELNLMEFGFKKNYDPSNTDQDWYYYTRKIGDVCLISKSNDEVGEDGSWHVRLFKCDTILVKDKARLSNLIHAIIQVTI
jgi:hypothetical protein